MLHDVIHVVAKPGFTLHLEFDNGEQRVFHMLDFIDQRPWNRLKVEQAFYGAFIENGTVNWLGNLDIDPETLYERSVPVSA